MLGDTRSPPLALCSSIEYSDKINIQEIFVVQWGMIDFEKAVRSDFHQMVKLQTDSCPGACATYTSPIFRNSVRYGPAPIPRWTRSFILKVMSTIWSLGHSHAIVQAAYSCLQRGSRSPDRYSSTFNTDEWCWNCWSKINSLLCHQHTESVSFSLNWWKSHLPTVLAMSKLVCQNWCWTLSFWLWS